MGLEMFFLCRYLLAGVQISNCFWKWYRVPKINTRGTPGWNLNAFDFCSMLIIHPRNGSMCQSFNNSCKWPPNRWGRGRLRARCRWRAGSCSSPRSRRCQSPGTARSTGAMKGILKNTIGGVVPCLYFLWPFLIQCEQDLNLHPQKLSGLWKVLPCPGKKENNNQIKIQKPPTLCKGNMTAVLKTPSKFRKW